MPIVCPSGSFFHQANIYQNLPRVSNVQGPVGFIIHTALVHLHLHFIHQIEMQGTQQQRMVQGTGYTCKLQISRYNVGWAFFSLFLFHTNFELRRFSDLSYFTDLNLCSKRIEFVDYKIDRFEAESVPQFIVVLVVFQ